MSRKPILVVLTMSSLVFADDVVPQEAVQQTTASIHASANVDTLAVRSTLPSKEHCRAYAKVLVSELEGKFHTRDLPRLIQGAKNKLETDFTLHIQDKKKAILSILDLIIDEIATTFLPDFLCNPIFRSMLDPLVQLLVTEGCKADRPPCEGSPTVKELMQFTDNLVEQAKGRLCLKDLPNWLNEIICESGRYNVSKEEKIACSQYIYSCFIDRTDTVDVPDILIDPIIHQLGNYLIEIRLSME